MGRTVGRPRRQFRDMAHTPVLRPSPYLTRAVWVSLILGLVLVAVGSGAGQGAEAAVAVLATAAALATWARVALVHEERGAWSLVAVGSSAYAAGWAVLFYLSAGEAGGPGGLNYSDCLSLLLYPMWHASTLSRLRMRVRQWNRRTLFDGAIVALAVSASAVSVAAQLLPRAFGQSWLSAVYAAAYPIGSGVLLVTVLTALVALRFQVDASWVLTAGACGSLFAGQVVFAINWSWAWDRFSDDADSKVKGKVGVMPLPAVAGGKSATCVGGWQWAVSAFSKHKADAAGSRCCRTAVDGQGAETAL